MNTSQSNGLTRMLALQFRRFQHWRAMRMYARISRLKDEAEWLYEKANRLIGRNVQHPMPLFDRDNQEGR